MADPKMRAALAVLASLAFAIPAFAAEATPQQPAAAPPPPPPPVGMVDQQCPATPGYNAHDDWPWLCRYRAANAALDPAQPPEAVFMGDSITEFWGATDPAFFAHGFVDRGISGQTSPQMVLRFMADVVALHPKVVHIMAGTNDVAGNTGPNSPEDYKNNIRAMVALAKANGIAVVIGSILPADHFDWRPALRPAAQIAALNAWLKDFAKAEGLVYADYYTALAGANGELPAAYSKDGVHPVAAGYAVMEPIAAQAIAAAEKQPGR